MYRLCHDLRVINNAKRLDEYNVHVICYPEDDLEFRTQPVSKDDLDSIFDSQNSFSALPIFCKSHSYCEKQQLKTWKTGLFRLNARKLI